MKPKTIVDIIAIFLFFPLIILFASSEDFPWGILIVLLLDVSYLGLRLSEGMEKAKAEQMYKKGKEEAELREKRRKEKEEFERVQKEKGLVKFVSHDDKEKWGTRLEVSRWREIDVGLSNNFAGSSPFEFEEFIGRLFKKMGYNVDVTQKTADYGVDVVARKGDEAIAIQVKQYAIGNNVGAKDVQQILGAMWRVKANQSIIITTSGFTVQAREQAKEAPVELWGKRTLHEMVRKYFIDID